MMRNAVDKLQTQPIQSHQTIFYQGITCSETQAALYAGGNEIVTSTGEVVVCKGRNYLQPINVLINPFFGPEIKDVNTQPFDTISSYFNPLKLATSSISNFANWYHGIEIRPGKDAIFHKPNSLKGHALNLSEISVGQETDMKSHLKKYEHWKKNFPNSKLIAYGVSRGAATTFNACAEFQYPELELVVLEACFYSLHDVLFLDHFPKLQSAFTTGLSLFTKYHEDGPSPKKNIEKFPENVPVVFVTSEIDKIVPMKSTERLAYELANKQKNDVYLLMLKNSGHPNYVTDNARDQRDYASLLQAIYLKYGMTDNKTFNLELAIKGQPLLEECFLNPPACSPKPRSILV